MVFVMYQHTFDCLSYMAVSRASSYLLKGVIYDVIFVFFFQSISPLCRYKNRPVMSGPGLYDPTTVLSSDNLTKNMREGWIKLAIYLISFFYYIYGFVFQFVRLCRYGTNAALFLKSIN